MSRSTMLTASRARTAALVLAGWLSFFALLSLLSATLNPDRAFDFGPVELTGALLWAALTAAIAAYHRWLRQRVENLFALASAHVPLLLFSSIADAFLTSAAVKVFTGVPPRLTLAGMTVYYLDFDLVAYALIVAGAELLFVRRALADRERQAQRLERSLARARLDYLEAQLQPHFLFNSLGAVSELAYDAPATATRVLRQLASIFRTALGRKTDEITLGDEIVGIEPYLDIQRIRFADWLTIDYRVDEAAVDCLVPRFVLQPLIENAIRHGLSGRRAAGTIEISAVVEGATLIVRVADNGIGLDAPHATSGRGIGLANVRDRLRILYGDDERLRLTSNTAGGAVAELEIPARRRESAWPEATERVESQIVEHVRSVALPRFLRSRTVILGGIWILTGIVWTQQSFLYLSIRDRLNGATWASLFRTDMVSAAVWALLTPIVLHFATRFPLRRRGIVWRSAIYGVFGVSAVLVHNLLWRRIVSPNGPVIAPQNQMSMVVGFLIVCVLVAVAHRDLVSAWLRDRENSTEALRAELEEARRRAEKLQQIPPVLLRSLDGIAETARRDPALTERQLTRLADYVRLALECTDQRGMTADRERALAAAFGELEATGAYSLTLTA